MSATSLLPEYTVLPTVGNSLIQATGQINLADDVCAPHQTSQLWVPPRAVECLCRAHKGVNEESDSRLYLRHDTSKPQYQRSRRRPATRIAPIAPACIDRGWRRCEKSTGTSSGEGQLGWTNA